MGLPPKIALGDTLTLPLVRPGFPFPLNAHLLLVRLIPFGHQRSVLLLRQLGDFHGHPGTEIVCLSSFSGSESSDFSETK